MDIHKVLEIFGTMAECGIDVKVVSPHRFEIGGFYKSGPVKVDFKRMEIIDRYRDITKFDEDTFVSELISVQKYWHDISKDRLAEWNKMDGAWVIFIERFEAGEFKDCF